MPESCVQLGTGTGQGTWLLGPHEAFLQLEARLRAVPPSDLLPMNVDGLHVVSVVLDAAPAFLALRPRMLTLAPELNLWLIDHCVPLAHAYCAVNSRYIPRHELRDEFRSARREGLLLRRRLRGELDNLIQNGVLPGKMQLALQGRRGHRQLAHDLTALARVFEEENATFSGKTAIGSAETARAAALAARLLAGCVRQRQRSPAEEEAALLKQQAFTLLCQAYREVRRAVTFLRDAEGDAERIAPLPYAQRSEKRARASADSRNSGQTRNDRCARETSSHLERRDAQTAHAACAAGKGVSHVERKAREPGDRQSSDASCQGARHVHRDSNHSRRS